MVCWNLERGERWEGIRSYLREREFDLLLLQKADWEARRSSGLRIAAELGRQLELQWVFAPEFLELGQRIGGADAWHGQATLARLPVTEVRVLRFREQSRSWKPKPWLPRWGVFQPREGGRIALLTMHRAAGLSAAACNVHLESREDEELRVAQVREVLEDAAGLKQADVILIAGDLNTKRGASSPVIWTIQSAGFAAAGGEVTTRRGQSLDWVFVEGRARGGAARIRTDVRASDHYPLEAELELAPAR